MKRFLILFVSAMLCLCLCACGSSDSDLPAEEQHAQAAVPTANPLLHVEELLQGTWEYYDESIGFGEIFVFKNGSVDYTAYVSAARDNDSNVSGSYRVSDSSITTVLNGHETHLDYEIDGDRMALMLYVDSGRDAGSTRVYYQTERTELDPELASVNRSESATTEAPHREDDYSDSYSKDNNIPDYSQPSSSGERNALADAKLYLEVMAFSYSGLIDQLEYEGYSYSEAKYGADNCGADWYDQAVLCAESYLEIMPFSRSELIDQLEYEGFTYDQASYAVDIVY